MSSLNESSGISNLISIYEKNKDKKWDEWLTFVRIFPQKGKQGIVGLFQINEIQAQIVFKFSNYFNYLVEHEYIVSSGLREISDFLPHLNRSIGMITCMIDPENTENPFEVKTKYPIEKKVLLLEFIQDSYKLYTHIISNKTSEEVIYTSLKQTLLALEVAQRRNKFTHYDLHSNNILLKKCSKNLVFLYIIQGKPYYIPTLGHYPIIIDYGFSYSSNLENNYLWPSMNHTEIGFTSDRFDACADPKLFLLITADEIHENFESKTSKRLNKFIRKNYKGKDIDLNTGRDTFSEKCATDSVIKALRKHNFSSIIKEYEYYAFDIINTLVILPLEENKCQGIEMSFEIFTKEFSKIEKEISSPFYCLYMLKNIVDVARIVRTDYLNPETRKKAVDFFRFSFFERTDSISKYCDLAGIHFEKMLCSLLHLGKCIENILHKHMNKLSARKKEIYGDIEYKSPLEFYERINTKILTSYTFNEKTVVMVVDSDKCSTEEFHLPVSPKYIEKLNSIPREKIPYELFKLYEEK